MMTRIKVFAFLQDLTGQPEIQVALTQQQLTAIEIKQAVAKTFPKLAQTLPTTRLAVNQTFVNDTDKVDLTQQPELALIPPVSGG